MAALLGSGGMGAVYKARQPKLDRFIAIKILDCDPTDTRFVERFTREARTLARLSHPNIVALHDFGERDGIFFLTMDFVDGVTLRDLLTEGKLAPEQALAIVPQICEALQYAHGKGVVHRDIKPENILLDSEGKVKVADFGIARLGGAAPEANLTAAGEVVGTAHYMAPEQVERPAEVDHRADIFALGVVFYEMLTGELPLGKFQPPSRKVQVDVRLDEVVLHALEKEPERRYQRAAEVKTDVETIAGSPRGTEPLPGQWPYAAVVTVLVLAVALIAWWALSAFIQLPSGGDLASSADAHPTPSTAVLAATVPASSAFPPPPPVVVGTIPESGSSGVDPALTEIQVTFSKPMQDGSWSWVNLGDGTFPEMMGTPRYLEDKRTCVLPVKLEPGKAYATWINFSPYENFQDTEGRSAVSYLLIFETRP